MHKKSILTEICEFEFEFEFESSSSNRMKKRGPEPRVREPVRSYDCGRYVNFSVQLEAKS